jgi:hypothetical protein
MELEEFMLHEVGAADSGEYYNLTDFAYGGFPPLYGEDNGFYGKTHTEETKTKIRMKKTGKKQSSETVEKKNTKVRKRVYCGTLEKEFDSTQSLIAELGISHSYASNMLNGRAVNKYKLMFL